MKKEDVPNNFSDTFFSKLKEQSFTIIILVGVMLYQNWLFTNQMNEYKSIIKEKENIVLKLTEDERQRLLEREKYLMGQRDEFVSELKDLIKNQK